MSPRSVAGCSYVVLAAFLAAGCTGAPKILPPRDPPPRSVPSFPAPTAPVPEGRTRVVLYTTDGPMKVTARADTDFVPPGMDVPPTRMGDLCAATPCVVDLPPGNYKLYLTAPDGTGDIDTLKVNAASTTGTGYWARAPGRYEPAQWAIVPSFIMGLGLVLVLTGIVLALPPDHGSIDKTQQTSGYGLVIGGGIAAIIGGALLYDQSRGSTQDGATTTWSEPAR
jgi:hypothetical protein